MILIGLAGLKGSGKDTAGQILVEEHGFELLKFAKPLYDSAAALLNVHPSILDNYKNDPRARVQLLLPRGGTEVCTDIERDFSVREYLQRYGTEAHRDIEEFGPSVWTDLLINKILAVGTASSRRFVVTDARFENECQALCNVGGFLYYIERDARYGDTYGDAHASEIPPPRTLIYNFIDNSGSLGALRSRMAALADLHINGRKNA